MPITPRPLSCMSLICSMTGGTSVADWPSHRMSSPSMYLPWGFTRTRWTSGQPEVTAAFRAGRVWQDTPLARIHFLSLASLKPSMARFISSIHPGLTMQWIRRLSM